MSHRKYTYAPKPAPTQDDLNMELFHDFVMMEQFEDDHEEELEEEEEEAEALAVAVDTEMVASAAGDDENGAFMIPDIDVFGKNNVSGGKIRRLLRKHARPPEGMFYYIKVNGEKQDYYFKWSPGDKLTFIPAGQKRYTEIKINDLECEEREEKGIQFTIYKLPLTGYDAAFEAFGIDKSDTHLQRGNTEVDAWAARLLWLLYLQNPDVELDPDPDAEGSAVVMRYSLGDKSRLKLNINARFYPSRDGWRISRIHSNIGNHSPHHNYTYRHTRIPCWISDRLNHYTAPTEGEANHETGTQNGSIPNTEEQPGPGEPAPPPAQEWTPTYEFEAYDEPVYTEESVAPLYEAIDEITGSPLDNLSDDFGQRRRVPEPEFSYRGDYHFQHPFFQDDPQLNATVNRNNPNNPHTDHGHILGHKSQSPAVKKIKAALLALYPDHTCEVRYDAEGCPIMPDKKNCIDPENPYFDLKTKRLVEEFQCKYDLDIDGAVGSDTLKELDKQLMAHNIGYKVTDDVCGCPSEDDFTSAQHCADEGEELPQFTYIDNKMDVTGHTIELGGTMSDEERWYWEYIAGVYVRKRTANVRKDKPEGAALLRKPDANVDENKYTEDGQVVAAKPGEHVKVLGFSKAHSKGYFYVELNRRDPDGNLYRGWMSGYLLNVKHFPDSQTRTVNRGESLSDIIEEKYGDILIDLENPEGGGTVTKADVAAAIYLANRDKSVIYLAQNGNPEKASGRTVDPYEYGERKLYDNVHVRGGLELELPSEKMVIALKKAHEQYGMFEFLEDLVDVGLGIAGFTVGLGEGIWEGAEDFVEGIDDIVDAIMSGGIIDQAKEMYDAFMEMTLEDLKELAGQMIGATKDEVLKAWNNPDPYEKWRFFGKLAGKVAFEVILNSLSGGAALAGKLGKLNKLTKAMDKITPKKLTRSQKAELRRFAERRKNRAQNKEIDRRKKEHGDAFNKDAEEVLRDPEIRRRDTEGKQMAKKEGRDLDKEAERHFDKENDGPKEKHDAETKKQKTKALASAKAIEAVDDAADVHIETLMGHLEPLAHIKGVQRFDEKKTGENRWTVYMFGSKSVVDEFDNSKKELAARKKRMSPIELKDELTVRGFKNAGEFVERLGNLRNKLRRYEYKGSKIDDLDVGVRGSSVTNTSSKSGGSFRHGIDGVEKPSDIDFFFSSKKLDHILERKGIDLSKPLSPKKIREFDPDLADILEEYGVFTRGQLGRQSDVYFMSQKTLNSMSGAEYVLK